MRRNGQPDRFVVIGGGISGLSSAFYLLREAKARGREAQVTIVDPSERLGGKINTLRRDGFVIERGPDSFLARKTPIIDLARQLGIEQELVGQNPSGKKSYILHRGKLHPMPPGLVLGIPTEIMPFALTGLLTWGGKLRALLDFVLPARKENGDESLGRFLSRRLGAQVTERIAEPLLAGIYAGDLSKLSLQATFPQFGEAERKHGSLIRGMRASRRKAPAAPKNTAGLPASAQGSMFLSFRGGLSTMVGALNESLTAAGVEKKLGTKAVEIKLNTAQETADRVLTAGLVSGAGTDAAGGNRQTAEAVNTGVVEAGKGSADRRAAAQAVIDGSEKAVTDGAIMRMSEAPNDGGLTDAPYTVVLDNGESIPADGVVVTAPAYDAADLLDPHIDTSALRAVEYVSVANVVMAFDKTDFRADFEGSGFVIPRSEGTTITACTWTSVKWLHTSPGDKVLLRCYIGRANDEAVVDLPDEQLAEAVRSDIRTTMGITAEPLFTEITRLHRSMPQYPVGHVQQTSAMREELVRKLPGVWVTGAAFDGVGLPDCIRQGREAAAKIYDMLGEPSE